MVREPKLAPNIVAEAITPEQLFRFDSQRGSTFEGPTPEEYLEWDEITAEAVDEHFGAGRTSVIAQDLINLDNLMEYLGLVRLRPDHRDANTKQLLKSMEERGDLPWQRR